MNFQEQIFRRLSASVNSECTDDEVPKDSLVWLHHKGNEIDAAAYFNGAELDSNTITAYMKYWTMFVHLPVKIKDAVAGWSKRNKSSGANIAFEINVEGNEYEAVAGISMFSRGLLGSVSVHVSDGFVSFWNTDGTEQLFAPCDWNTDEAVLYESGVSEMMKDAIESGVNRICETIADSCFALTGQTQMF